jgi:hypothetical protein
MSLRTSFPTFVAIALLILFSANATTQSRAQTQVENANAIASLCETASIKPSKSGILAGMTTHIGPDGLTATNQTPQALIQG